MNKERGYYVIFLVLLVILTSSSCKAPEQDSVQNIKTLSTSTPKAENKPAVEEIHFSYNGYDRSYLLRVPLGLDDSLPAAVVFLFHGMGDVPQSMFRAGFNSLADQEKIVLVYPDLISETASDFTNPDYIDQILQHLSDRITIDPSRTYAVGFSLGGRLAYYVACDLSDSFTAFAAVAGMAICDTTHVSDKAVPIIHIHGLGDDLVPFETGAFGMPPVDDTIEYWTAFNECVQTPFIEKTGKISHYVYSQCRDGVEIELYTIDRMGHKFPPNEIGSQVIWEFFEAHTKP